MRQQDRFVPLSLHKPARYAGVKTRKRMFDYPALTATFAVVSIYGLVGFYYIFLLFWKPPQSAMYFLLVGVALISLAAFILTAANESIALATKLLEEYERASIKGAALVEFRQYMAYLGHIVTFLLAGIGITAIGKAMPSPNVSGPVSREEHRQLRDKVATLGNEVEALRYSLVLLCLMVLVAAGFVWWF
jgi:hypothetical protein